MEKKTSPLNLDAIDKAILELLQDNAKMNVKQVAAKVGLSVTPTYERIKRLEKTGVIAKYTAILDKKKIQKQLEVFCQVSLQVHSKDNIDAFESKVILFDQVMECYHIAGSSDYLLKVLVTDMDAYQSFLKNELSILDSISNVQSTFVMSTLKNTTSIPIT